MASSWTNANGAVPLCAEQHDRSGNDDTERRGTGLEGQAEGRRDEKAIIVSDLLCLWRDWTYARDCENRKSGEQAFYAGAEDDIDEDDRTVESAFVTSNEVVLFA